MRAGNGFGPGGSGGPAACPVEVRAGLWQRARQQLVRGLKWIELMDQVRSERQAMAGLSQRDFSDMGIDVATALNESERGLFDLPADRLAGQTAAPKLASCLRV